MIIAHHSCATDYSELLVCEVLVSGLFLLVCECVPVGEWAVPVGEWAVPVGE